MDFTISTRAQEFQERISEFLREHVFPLEGQLGTGLSSADLNRVRGLAKNLGLWAPQLPVEYGGQALEFADLLPAFEAAGRSLLGPLCLGCAAPDEGNAHLLLRAGDARQKETYLKPLAVGSVRSCFAMTEPAPGAGSDPRMMRTRAVQDGDHWVIDGHKWFATGAEGATFSIVAAVSDPDVPIKEGCTLFLVDTNTPGFQLVRKVPTPGASFPGGHCEIRLESCRVADNQVLGEVGRGFALMQERLGPARLTHCMRWLGAAQRALEIAIDYARERQAFGKTLTDHQGLQWMLADRATELQASRLLVHEAAWRLQRGDRARREVSMCKVFVSEAIYRAIDLAVQICGAKGVSDDLPLAHLLHEARAFRIYDGPSEVHRMVVARELLR